MKVKNNDFLGTPEYLDEVARMLATLPNQLGPFIDALYQAYLEDRPIFLIGNGGSAANASHFGQDLNKQTLPDPSVAKRFRAVALTDNVSFLTALANDLGYESVFEQQLMTLGRQGDVLVAISVSGNSPNVLRAVGYANSRGMRTIGVTGCEGGRLLQIAQINVNVPSNDIGLVEAVHSVIFHLSILELRQRIMGWLPVAR
ncbi:MAG: SIS domain-containing protein [Candidatus Methylomirabilales bacterium]